MNFFESIVFEYNKEFGCSLKITENTISEFYLPHINNIKKVVYIDNKTTILQLLYFYGSPKLFHIYRLIYGLYSYRYYDECNELLPKLEQIFKSNKKRIENLKEQELYGIISQLKYIVLHELAHFTFYNNLEYKQRLVNYCKQQLQRPELLVCISDDMKPLYHLSLDSILADEILLEEFAADLSAFHNMIISLEFMNFESSKNVIICASSISSIYFIEYVSRIERLYFNAPNYNNEIERFNDKIQNEIKGSFDARLRILMVDLLIRDLWEKHPITKKEQKLYTSLVAPVVGTLNENINLDLLNFISPYYEIFKGGGSIDVNHDKKKQVEYRMGLFNVNVINLLNSSLLRCHSELRL